ncbi:MAG: hypothetical protein KAU62_01045 [Candidatus Heimdallarchaeota archaeon]|nr:hypothetical protein [Candidatus Heimdallarchaeota archaeon]MCK4609719.1 hypothetical protein [Candidatus Heimdallarchaeota archaeon]
MSQLKSSNEYTNWLSFLHDEYISAMQMGKYNYDSIQLTAKWWGAYLEIKYIAGPEHICWFMAAMFRLTYKYILRGGIGHMAQKGNENVEALLQTATKIEKISFKKIAQPNIDFIPSHNIRPSSWENQFELLAVDIVLNPTKYPAGYEIKTEKDYSSPISLTALKSYLRTLERGISYEIKRKVISKLNEAQSSIDQYIKELNEKIEKTFFEAAKKINETSNKVNEIDKAVDTKIQGLKGKINLVLKKQLDELDLRYELLIDLSNDIDELEKKLGQKKLFSGFIGRKNLKKLLKKLEG